MRTHQTIRRMPFWLPHYREEKCPSIEKKNASLKEEKPQVSFSLPLHKIAEAKKLQVTNPSRVFDLSSSAEIFMPNPASPWDGSDVEDTIQKPQWKDRGMEVMWRIQYRNLSGRTVGWK
ncbi:hypothetical protein RRG08_008780 [Elysia crispata]|uniref:Uncharacterized protein n=1 Tax=Elysia crispata TaxID=231223 RepID=A0AAE0Z7P8_9GAST|nr:hypothetical protein RRG08_008780 [Elysia crispata]